MTVFISNLSLAKSNYYHDNQNGQKAVTLNKVAIHCIMLCCIKNQVIILKGNKKKVMSLNLTLKIALHSNVLIINLK